MWHTPESNRALPSGKDKTPLGSRILPGKDKTPLGNRILPPKDKVAAAGRSVPAKVLTKEQNAVLDQQLLALLRSLNLAIAQVSQVRELRYSQPEAAIPAAAMASTLQHLLEAQALVEGLTPPP